MGDVAADVAQLKCNNNECHASAFRYNIDYYSPLIPRPIYMCELYRHENSFCLFVPRESLSDTNSNMESELSRAGAMTDWLMRLSHNSFDSSPFSHTVINIISWTPNPSKLKPICLVANHQVTHLHLATIFSSKCCFVNLVA